MFSKLTFAPVLKRVWVIRDLPKCVIEGPIFRLYARFTSFVFLVFWMILTMGERRAILCQLFQDGEKVRCGIHGTCQEKKMIESYCWISSTFSLFETFTVQRDEFVAHPGLGNADDDDKTTKYYNYFLWIPYALILQLFFIRCPKYIWADYWEENHISKVVHGLNLIGDNKHRDEDVKKKSKKLVEYLIKHMNLHKLYVYKYWLLELFCVMSIILQMYFMDWFLAGEFRNFGFNFFKLLELSDVDPRTRSDAFVYVFPRVTKCTFRRFGPTKTIEKLDVMCVLYWNHFIEKMYIFIWFWFSFLLILFTFLFIHRITMILSPRFRSFLFRYKSNNFIPSGIVDIISQKLSVSDWWVLNLLNLNVDHIVFRDAVIEFAKELTKDNNAMAMEMKIQ